MDFSNSVTSNCSDLEAQSRRKPEDSTTSSRLKILSRGDILGAMNCIFPDMQLVHSETHNELREIFASAKKFRNEVSVDFETRKRNLQQELSEMINDETESDCQNLRNSQQTTVDFQHQAKTILKHKTTASGKTLNPLDADYRRFVEDLLADQYAPRSADFRNFEEIIAFLDHKSIEAESSTARHIAPFNSNLPVLNISKCEARQPIIVPPNTNANPKGAQSKLYSSLLKPLLTDALTTSTAATNISKKTANSKARRVPKKSEEGRALTAIEKSNSRKQSKRERGRRSRPKPCQSGDLVLNKKDSIIDGAVQFSYNNRGPPLLETPTDSSVGPTPKLQTPIVHGEDLRQLNDRIERDMHDLLLHTDESVAVVDPSIQTSASVTKSPNPTSSQEIFLLNLKTLQQQTTSTEQQQRLADEQQRLMTTLFLKKNFSTTNIAQQMQNLPFQNSTYTQPQSQSTVLTNNPSGLVSSASNIDRGEVPLPLMPSGGPEPSTSIGDLERQALNQYRTSDESIMEAEFTRLEREAQEQYPY